LLPDPVMHTSWLSNLHLPLVFFRFSDYSFTFPSWQEVFFEALLIALTLTYLLSFTQFRSFIFHPDLYCYCEVGMDLACLPVVILN
jgi:hypothetical protein